MPSSAIRKRDKDPNAFPTAQLLVLAICRFSEPIAFNSILAYSYVMVVELQNGDETDAGFYSGLLVSAYAVAEAITALGWGSLSDRYGRKPVVLIGLGGVAISSLIFGLAKSYWIALLARFVGGALNGNVAVMQTMVAEMVKRPEHEPKAYAVQPFVWTLGGILGSAMGGFLAQPAIFYPNAFPKDGLFGRYPYLLPNLVAVVVIVLAIIQGFFFLEETNPLELNIDDQAIAEDASVDERTPFRRRPERASFSRRSISQSHSRPRFIEGSMPLPHEQNFDLRRTSFGTMHSFKLPEEFNRNARSGGRNGGLSRTNSFKGKTFNTTVVMLTVALVIISYHQMAFITVLPIHLLDEPKLPPGVIDLYGGFGYNVHDVGIILAVNGVIGLLIQGLIFPIFIDKLGVWKSFVWMIVLYPLCYIIMPFLTAASEEWIYPGIYAALLLQSFFGIIVTPAALILLKDATPSPLVLGKVNGLAMSACCLARTVGPPLVGIIYSLLGSAAAWFSCAIVAGVGLVQLYWVPRKHVHHHVTVDSIFTGRRESVID